MQTNKKQLVPKLMILISFIVLLATGMIFNQISTKTKLEDVIEILVGVIGIITILTGGILYIKRRDQ
jgi:nitrate reductase gamma subunit